MSETLRLIYKSTSTLQSVPDNVEYQLGVSPFGLVQHEGKTRLAIFSWPLIDAINFKHQELKLTVRSKEV